MITPLLSGHSSIPCDPFDIEAVLGYIARYIGINNLAKKTSLQEFTQFLRAAFQTKSIEIFIDHYGQFAGYVIWAEVNEITITKIISGSYLPTSPSDFHSGNTVIVLDFFSKSEHFHKIALFLRHMSSMGESVVYSVRRNNRRFYKRLTRKRQSNATTN